MAVDQLLVSLLLAPAAGTAACRILVDLLPPKAAVLGFTVAAGLFALAGTLSLFAFGMPAVAGVVGALDEPATAASWSAASLPRWLSWTCLLLGAVAVLSVLVTGQLQRGSVHAARREASALPGGAEIVVLPDGRADAFALPGLPGRIVVTEGMLTAVGAGRQQALFAHERAHLTGRHHLFAFAARLAAAALPTLRPMVILVDYAIERWADEQAAEAVGDRRSVAHVVGTAALAATAQATSGDHDMPGDHGRAGEGGLPVGGRPRAGRGAHVGGGSRSGRVGFGRRLPGPLLAGRTRAARPAKLRAGAPGRGPRPGPVPRRIEALLATPQRRKRLMLVVLPAALAAASCGVAVEALMDLPYRRVFDAGDQ